MPRAKIEALGAPYMEENLPDWIVSFGPLQKKFWEKIKVGYVIVAKLDVYPYPTQRPELNAHAFTPLPQKRGVIILRRKG